MTAPPTLYWRRALSFFLAKQQGPITVEMEDVNRLRRYWSGELVGLGRKGPIVMWRGERRLLCSWEQLRSVADGKVVESK